MQSVSHHGRKTAYRQTGHDSQGPTTLYVHGSGGNHRLWGHQYAPTGPAHPAIALDLSGHGDSDSIEAPAGKERLAAYADDVTAVARETEADVLVGNSLGGAVVFEVLLSGRYEPAGAVFAGTGAKLAVDEMLRDLLADDFESAVAQLHEPGMLLGETDEQLRERSKETLRDAGQEVTRNDFLTCHEFDIRDRLGEISVPGLAVVGENDRLTPPSYHEYLAETLPECEYQTIPEAGHLAMLERPDAFNDSVESFVAETVEK